MQADHIPLHEIEQNIIIRKIEECTHYHFQGDHRHNFYEALYFTLPGEKAVHSIDFTKSVIKSNCIYLIKPGQVYKMELTSQQGYLIAIKAEFFNDLRSNFDYYLYFTLPNIIPMDSSDLQLMEQMIILAQKELQGKQRQELIASLIRTLITPCMLSHKEQLKKAGIDNRVLRLIALVDKHFIDEREVAFYAEKVSLSEKRLGILTKESLGITVKQLIQKRILLEAKRLISYGELSFKSIAFQLGFKDASYFSRFFKIYSGIAPEEFKVSLSSGII